LKVWVVQVVPLYLERTQGIQVLVVVMRYM
jgi:hypothetical protein